MKRLILIIGIILINVYYSSSQNWSSLGIGLNGPVFSMYNDTENNLLYVGEASSNIDSLSIKIWNGNNYSSFGNIFSILDIYKNNIIKYKGEIYAGGINKYGIQKFDGTSWVNLGAGLNNNAKVNDLMIYNNELYVAGGFDTAGGNPATGLAKWDGNNWNTYISPIPSIYGNPSVKSMVYYNNELYVAGGFYNGQNSGLFGIAHWDGSNWQPLEWGLGMIEKIIVYKGELYVAGGFTEELGAIGNCIQKWNGSSWSKVGYGVFGNHYVNAPRIYDMEVINNDLYVIGEFYFADSIPAKFIAKWNGNRWCSLGSDFNSSIVSINSYNNNIIIGGWFTKIDNDTIYSIAKWIGGNYVDTCGVVHGSGVNDNELQKENISIYPNPVNSFINLEAEIKEKEEITISIFNSLGVKVYESIEKTKTGTFSKQLDIANLSTGLYIVNISSASKHYSKRIVKL